ncbi:MAG: GWxTD domain-containing protein [Acidobacteria bacterium]|nr:GWxTD domain-containing protein [Acidobacteriota bacterium]
MQDNPRIAMCGMVLFLVLSLLISPLTGFAQVEKKVSKSPKNGAKEIYKNPYKQWINEDVPWIISAEERKAFNTLKTDDEREQFIEMFWQLRDPDPDTDSNEYREEYYQRIAYSNEKYTSGIQGWKTDRGRIYIMFGKPDQIESHPSGGSYDRPTWEGGGTTSTYPFEIWWYRYIEGVGSDIEIEFVDPTGSGEYRIARGPDEKDALLNTPNAGLTLAEQLGLRSKADRIAYGPFGQGGQPFGMRAKDQPFDKLATTVALQRPPRVRFNSLAALADESELPRFGFNILPFDINVNMMRATDTAVMTSFTVQMDNEDLVFKEVGGLPQATVNIYAKISNVAGRRAGQFEDVVTRSFTPDGLSAGQLQKSTYNKNVVLAPGIYKVDMVVRDVKSGRTGVQKLGFTVPRYEEGKLSHSTLILASSIQPLTGRLQTGQFVFGSLKVIPNATAEYKQDQMLGIYMQVYNIAIDQATLKPSVDIEYVITQLDKEILRVKEDGKNSLSTINRPQITLARLFPLKDFRPGSYDVQVVLKDNVASRIITTAKDVFHVK